MPALVLVAIAFLLIISFFYNSDSGMASVETRNVAAVLNFVEQGYNEQDTKTLRSAFAPNFIQHTPYIPDGPEGFISFYRREFANFPNPYMDVKRMFAENDLVILQTHLLFDKRDIGNDYGTGYALVSMFRMDDEHRIAEYWGLTQQVNPYTSSINGNSLFDGAVNKRTKHVMAAKERGDSLHAKKRINQRHRDKNKRVVLEYSRLFFDEGDYDNPKLRKIVAHDLIQHNLNEPNGLDGLIEIFRPLKKQFPDVIANVKQSVADGDFVITQVHYAPRDSKDYTSGPYAFDIYRLEKGVIVEHWDVVGDLSQIENTRIETNTNPIF